MRSDFLKWKQRKPLKSYYSSSGIVEKLANIRGINDLDAFLNPPSSSLYSPYILKNAVEVAKRIAKAIQSNERIAVSADCDSDGISSTAIMINYLKEFTNNVYYIFNERSEGHGIEKQLHKIEGTTDLLIILDSSSNSAEACKIISEAGIEILIIDHHEIEVKNPYATIVNPQGDNYPNKSISGAGVTWKVLQVLDDMMGSGNVDQYLDLVACGMISDMMDISVSENRYMIITGMKNINNLGLKMILNSKGVPHDEVDSKVIGFSVTPLINSVARMDNIELAIKLLIEENEIEANTLVKAMEILNMDRKTREKELFSKYEENIIEEDKIIIVTDEESSKGFNGLIAQRIAQSLKKPALVLRDHKDTLSGSGRSFGGFNLKNFLQESGLVEEIGGHAEAFGVTIKKEKLADLKKYIEENIDPNQFNPVIEYDYELNATEITRDLIEEIQQINILTGMGFPRFFFKVKGLLVENRRIIGRNKNVCKITSGNIEAIRFNADPNYASDINSYDTIDILGELGINKFYHWKLRAVVVTPQIVIEDYKSQL